MGRGRAPGRREDALGSEAVSTNRLTQADRSALSERRTLEAAVELMGELGYEKTTLAAIGEAAGYSRGLATHHFGSKPDLFARVIRWISEKARAQFEPSVQQRHGLDALFALLDAYTKFTDENPTMTRARYVLWFQSLISDSPMRDAAIEDLLGHRDRVRRIIEEGIAAGTVRAGTDASAEATQFCGALFGLGLQWLIDPTGSRIEDMHRRFKERLGATLRP
jgi:AcrR family transcriptional regulator